MPELNRRRFLGSLAAATVAGVGVARLIVDPQPRTFAQVPAGTAAATSGPTAPGSAAALLPPPPLSARIPLPGGGALMKIPGDGDLLALCLFFGRRRGFPRYFIVFVIGNTIFLLLDDIATAWLFPDQHTLITKVFSQTIRAAAREPCR